MAEGRTTPQSREAALRLLREILPGIGDSGSYTANSIRRMEQALAESDKILRHWKR